MSVDEDIDARRIARWKFPYEGPPDQVIPTSDASRDLSVLQTYNLGHIMVETYSYARAWMGVHERAWARMGVHERAVGVRGRGRVWARVSVDGACVWRAHDVMHVHMTRHCEVNHRRNQAETQLIEVNIALP